MRDSGDSERILVLAPIGRDGELAAQAIRTAGLQAFVCVTAAELCSEIERGAGAALLTEEALNPASIDALSRSIGSQPPWSDFPLIVFSGIRSVPSERPIDYLARLLNVTILDRPVHVRTAMSAINSALRSRRRQYEARRAIRQRDQFLAMLGHELRNPLGAIVLASYTLREAVGTDVTLQRCHAVIDRQTKHLARLIDELLDVARMTSGKVILRREPINLTRLVGTCLQTLEVAARASELTLHAHLQPVPILIDADAVRIEQVITNIVTNATKYTPPGGRIDVTLTHDATEATIRVRDTGSGIAAPLLHRVFDLFAQAEDTLARSRGGLGIGLTIVRQLVELHGGRVTAKSDGVGRGSEFTVTLPLLIGVQEVLSVPGLAGSRVTAQRIVVLEDNEDVREGLRALLTRDGHSVTTAEDGTLGAALIVADPPDLAFIDIGLPGIDGYEVARRVRQTLGERPVLIALTGYGQTEDRQRALAAGFNVHLTKPIDRAQLERVLGTAFH